MALTGHDLLMIVIAILLPPLAVFLEEGRFGADVIINICLTLLGYLPGVIPCSSDLENTKPEHA